jgi:Cu(I)/Ag(I) efflux system membrane protein CusA/SilA
MTPEKLVEELDRAVKVPGLSNIWMPPIRNRIDMLATGIKSPIGVKVTAADLAGDRPHRGSRSSRSPRTVPGVSSALAERLTGGRYVDVQIDRAAAARYGLNIADVQAVVAGAVGGENVSARRSKGWRASRSTCAIRANGATRPSGWQQLPILTPMGQQITLGSVARIASPTARRCSRARTPGPRAGSMSMCAAATWPRWPRTCAMR